MKALDTNVLVRFLVADDPAQAELARKTIEAQRQRGEPLYLSTPVLLECAWVLESRYGLGHAELAAVLGEILRTREFEVQQRDATSLALEDFVATRGDFGDCLIGRLARQAGAETTLTFDRGLRRNPAFTLL